MASDEDAVSLGEVRRNFAELKTYIGDELRSLRQDMVIRDVYVAEQDHLKDRVKSLESTRSRLVGTVATLSVTVLAQIIYAVLTAKH